MNSIKDALVRLSRVVRQLESDGKKLPIVGPRSAMRNAAKHQNVSRDKHNVKVIRRPDRNIENVSRYSALVRDHQKERFRDFLRPLGIPNLKTLQETGSGPKQYDTEKARNNWLINKDNLRSFLYNREAFSKMMDLIRDLTPPEYVATDKSPEHIRRIIEVDEIERRRSSFHGIGPKNSFSEIPSMPEPLTPESFRKWIYQLTHTKYHYRNLSSLKSGIVADILLYTHNLENTQFKRFRSVDTYNYLIKWFGYDKNQNSFARELILVMNKDGHSINLDTINQLLKICTTHLHIRQLSNTYHNISQNLRLAQKLGLGIDLTTFHRVYDCISSIYLRELYLNRLTSIGVPILRGLIVRIVGDFAQTTKSTAELIQFIENSLKIVDWKGDSHVYNQVVVHRARHETLEDVLEGVAGCYDAYTVKYLMESVVQRNGPVSDLWKIYKRLPLEADGYLNVVIVFRFLVQKTLGCEAYTARQKIFIVRGIMHEMINGANMPLEVEEHVPMGRKRYQHYSMFKRVVGRNYKGDAGSLTRLEACARFYYGSNVLSQLLSEAERQAWKRFLADGVASEECVDERGEIVAARAGDVSNKYIARYEAEQGYKLEQNRVRERLLRLEAGSLKEEVAARGIGMGL